MHIVRHKMNWNLILVRMVKSSNLQNPDACKYWKQSCSFNTWQNDEKVDRVEILPLCSVLQCCSQCMAGLLHWPGLGGDDDDAGHDEDYDDYDDAGHDDMED